MDNISKRIRQGLEMRNMTQSDLVKKTGIGKGAISCYLKGSYKPKQKNIFLIAQALDVSIGWLMGYDVPAGSFDGLLLFNLTDEDMEYHTNSEILGLNPIPNPISYPKIDPDTDESGEGIGDLVHMYSLEYSQNIQAFLNAMGISSEYRQELDDFVTYLRSRTASKMKPLKKDRPGRHP